MLTLTLESKPANTTHWSTRSMVQRTGLSLASIHRIWHVFSLAPHRAETLKLSHDPLFIDKVRDIVGLYLDPSGHALVRCMDEKSQIQALALDHATGRLERSHFAALSNSEPPEVATSINVGILCRGHRSARCKAGFSRTY